MLTIYNQILLQAGCLHDKHIISFNIDTIDVVINYYDKNRGSNYLKYLSIRKQRNLRNNNYQITTIGEIDYNLVYENGGDRILIYDILLPMAYRNKGYGSILMQRLVDFAKAKGIKGITGELGKSDLCDTSDINHCSRMLHFYRKHQFKIDLLPHGCFGQIELTL